MVLPSINPDGTFAIQNPYSRQEPTINHIMFTLNASERDGDHQ